MSQAPDCIFCRIVAGGIPSRKIAESRHGIAILDAFPVSEGHSLVITKRHAADAFDLTDEEIADVNRLLRDVAYAVRKSVGCPGINLMANIGRPAGQVVFHAHYHAIPRFEDDGITIKFGGKVEQTDEEKDRLLGSIVVNLPAGG
jgi:histidine triad (HIT) family protein